ncbi:MAG: ubiquinone/menaquinone biosynthesis C-methylase UbiE [Polaribacter sp.]
MNVPCGTGVNFKYFQSSLENSGLIIGIDLSSGMLDQAKRKTKKNGWTNIDLELVIESQKGEFAQCDGKSPHYIVNR